MGSASPYRWRVAPTVADTREPGAVQLAELRPGPITAAECEQAVAHPAVGGIALFVGTVRDHDGGRPVRHLHYEAHPSAAARLAGLAAHIGASPGVRRVAVLHRLGQLEVGEVAVVVAVGAGHRDEAFTACRRFIDELKAGVPIWKRQTFTDGRVEWVGSPG